MATSVVKNPPQNPVSIKVLSASEEQTIAIAALLAARLKHGDVLALEGPLGSGKTCFVRGLASGLGINPSSVSSPTFVICQEYAGQGHAAGMQRTLIHIDAYRLSGPDELESIGWQELLEAPNTILAIEWPSRIAAALPTQLIELSFEHCGEHERSITITAPASMADRLSDIKSTSASKPESSKTTRPCRTCSRPAETTSTKFPFCSTRCKMADLGKWFSGNYLMSRPVEEDEELQD